MSHHQPLSFQPQNLKPFKDLQRSIHLSTQYCDSTSTTSRHKTYHLCLRACTSRRSNDNNQAEVAISRRTANYPPSLWDYDFLQSLKSEYTEEKHMLKQSHASPLSLLKLVDTIQKLGIDYHFDDEIKVALDIVDSTKDMDICGGDLYTIALRFRLLRQHGYQVSPDVFQSFGEKLRIGALKHVDKLENDNVMGILSLYEASFFAFEGEDIMDEAQQFTVKHLTEFIRSTDPQSMISKQVRHALELPLQWRAPRFETCWFLAIYAHTSTAQEMDPLLFEFAKLDFNMVQATHQHELVYSSRWWRELDLTTVCHFARSRVAENFLGHVGFYHEPKFGYCRKKCAQVSQFLYTIDDMYDVYGSIEELRLFTEAVERWDINRLEHLPPYMKIVFFALYNTINEIAYEVLRKHGLDVIQYLKNAWSDLCKAYLVEAEWYNNGYTPTLEEYLENGWLSIAVPMLQIHFYFLLDDYQITKEALDCFKTDYPDMIRWTCLIIRLADDLATSTDELKRGDVPKSIQCYMKHAGVTEYMARKHIKYLISETWKKINTNEAKALSIFPKSYINALKNITRGCQCYYSPGDGFGIPDTHIKSWILSMIVEPIPFFLKEAKSLNPFLFHTHKVAIG
ncbi:hypothetical protein MKW94_007038 [Papaver nudicaule]|uniref:Uncharacterized protein n=1 Tax=Papaver nudicaule TaxID=74823 RepID=A0AA41VER5_PAPNU|nr:hypothetical protein [Papaver nudicaule]